MEVIQEGKGELIGRHDPDEAREILGLKGLDKVSLRELKPKY